MRVALSLDALIAFDDHAARRAAYRILTEHLLSAPALEPLFPSREPPHPPAADPAWIHALAHAVLRLWLSTSGIGWVPDPSVGPAPPATLDGLLRVSHPGHRATAEAFYDWALPAHSHGEGVVLMAYLVDHAGRWGERLADWATTDGMETLQRTGESHRILGMLRWLAPDRVPDVTQAFAASPVLSEPGFRFQKAELLDHVFPPIVSAIHRRLNEGTLTSLGGFILASSLDGESALVEVEEPVPHLTETLLAERFAALSAAERRMLGDALVRALPILRKAVGQFIEPTIRRLASPQD